MSWTSKTPTEPGRYWFYGSPFGNRGKFRLELVSAHFDARKRLSFSTPAAFIYPGRERGAAVGYWMKAEIPEIPEDVEGILACIE